MLWSFHSSVECPQFFCGGEAKVAKKIKWSSRDGYQPIREEV